MSSTSETLPILSPSILPSGQHVVFKDSSFFTRPDVPSALPSPAQVRAAALPGRGHPLPVAFPTLNLLVKYGPEITIAEGQCLWAIRHLLHDLVPAPEVYGWCEDEGVTFIYMELIDGVTLEERWPDLSTTERQDICQQLRVMVDSMRTLRQPADDQFIGHIGRQPLLDIILAGYVNPCPGPFHSVAQFHDYFVNPRSRLVSPHPMRSDLPDTVPIIFTHGDLHPSNILVSSTTPARVVAIVDWHQSGWLPEYWEYSKARWTAKIGGEWEVTYIPTFLKTYPEFHDTWDYFVLALGC